jgi:mannose-1-phosphate guanylyltransferase/mannose-6-phosphate isomerase
VVTGDAFRFLVLEQLAAVGQQASAVLIEPCARNTGPAILAAALHLAAEDPDALMLVAPSDHVIPDAAGFRAAVEAACEEALTGTLITFGIRPTRPETGYGYLELGEGEGAGPVPLRSFVEKPEAARAEEMLRAGGYLWNAGIFLATAGTMAEAFREHQPEMHSRVQEALAAAGRDLQFLRLGEEAFAQAPSLSIDYAVMEKASRLAAMPYEGAWSDLGSWDAVWQEFGPDAEGNVTQGAATAIDCEGTLLRSEAPGLELVGIGLRDLVAVAMPDAVLIAPRSEAQRVKEGVEALKAKGKHQADTYPVAHRPWGTYESLVLASGYQVKRIVVNPGQALSLQSHEKRSEHWIIVQGTARVTVDDTVRDLSANESAYIPIGAKHRLENATEAPLVMVEVQTGGYLGEDDIQRYEDRYRRP